jgi:CRP-like cAMP-binding protein
MTLMPHRPKPLSNPQLGELKNMKDGMKQLLQRSGIFMGLDDEQTEKVLALGQERQIALGQAIAEEEEDGTGVFLLLQGRVNVEMRHLFLGGQPQVLGTIESGETFAEMSLIDQRARSATCRAIEPVVVLHFENDDLETLMARTPEIGYRVMRNLAGLLATRLRNLNVKMQKAMIDIFYY